MAFDIGAKLGAYEILEPLGAGGMGEVYRARDSKLKRDVAIKLLPSAMSHDPESVARFQREAEVLASLNHPHIAAIYDLITSGEFRFLVLELVDGETLSQRIARGPLSAQETLRIGRQVADALESAHEKGIIHRDLKPANIKVGSDGKVKVLDFGLAKILNPLPAAELANSPTRMSVTTPGVVLGTAAYMSPEQAKGKEAGRSTDVWAFGCVLYEMLTGRSVFHGDSTGELLAEVLKTEPKWHLLPRETPEAIRRLLRRCLQKDASLRLRDIADARIEIDEAASSSNGVAELRPPTSRRERFLWISTVGLLLLTAALVFWAFPSRPIALEMRVEITTPPTTDLVSLAISPDGRKLAFVGVVDGRPRLWLRPLDSVSKPLAGTDFAQYPFWDPNSRRLGFFADGKLKHIDIDGGSPEVIADAPNPRGAQWSHDGAILFAGGNGPIQRIPSTGGAAVPITLLGPGHQSHRFPHVLPGGSHFLYYVLGGPDVRGIYVGSTAGEPTSGPRLLATETAAVYASSGQLLYMREGTLVAHDFDINRLEVSGEPVLVAEDVARDPLSVQLPAVSVSEAGPIVYRVTSGSQRQLAWFDRMGTEAEKVGDPDATNQNPALSFDDRMAALVLNAGGNVDVWLLDLVRGAFNKFTTAPSIEAYPVFSPDGSRIAFGAFRKSQMDLYWKFTNGTGTEELLLETASEAKAPTDWSRDGRFILYRSAGPKTDYDVWALPVDQNGKPGQPIPVAQTAASERDGQFSRDGNWVAFESNESGRSDVYVQQFPVPRGRIPVSVNGGAQVRWSPTGKELFYIALDGKLIAVPVTSSSDGQKILLGTPMPLFANPVGGALQGAARQQYAVSRDGQRFLMLTIPERGEPITLILNWTPKR